MGIIGGNDVAFDIYEGLIALQHRGQDSCGIITYNRQFHLKKGLGLARDVFDENNMVRLTGKMGIGHTRYVTVGNISIEDAQPFKIEAPYGIALAHNGNIFNFHELREELFKKELRHINSDCDAEVILNIFALELEKGICGDFIENVFNAVSGVYKRAKGAYSVVGIIADKGLFAFRDPHGIKPLVIGERKIGEKTDYVFASENTMFSALDFSYVRDISPGEAVFVDLDGNFYSRTIEQKSFKPCVFEYVYFARPDSMLDRVSVYRSRLRMGQNLALKIKKERPGLEVDVVIPAPSTANTAALSLARALGVRYSEGLYKNNFIGRTFIMPGQEQRKRSLKFKISPIELEIRNKNILIVDDSIVRGNTSLQIVNLVRKCGAKKVYFASASPPLRFPCLYGIDMPSRKDFIANYSDIESIRKKINVDYLVYQDLDDLVEAVTRKGDHKIIRPCHACFSGEYPTEDITEETLNKAEALR